MFNLVTGKEKEFNTIIARSGAGKTALAYLLVKHYNKPTIIIDCFEQFKGNKISFSTFLNLSTNINYLDDFYKNKRQVIIDARVTESEEIFKILMQSKRFHNLLVFVDEIDLFLQSNRVNNKHPFYEFVNRGRHKEFYLITTSRNTANIPKPLIAQTDYFYFSDLIEKGALDMVDETLKGFNISGVIRNLEKYEFLKVDVNRKILQRLRTKAHWLEYFTQIKNKGNK